MVIITINCYNLKVTGQDFLEAGPWYLTSITGELKLNGIYREQETTTNLISDNQKYSLLNGGILLQTRSYFVQPKFFTLDIDAEYNPAKEKQQYLIIPEHSEIRTTKKLDIRSTVFNQYMLTIIGFANIGEAYSNRENMANLKTNSTNLGGMLTYNSYLFPLTIGYHDSKWDQTEIGTDRKFHNEQSTLEASVRKSFFSSDLNEFVYTHDNYLRRELDLEPIQNISDKLELKSSLYFDKKKNVHFNSILSGFDQRGNDSYKRYQANENLNLRLPLNFNYLSSYNYYNIQKDNQSFIQQSFLNYLRHRLGECLSSNIFTEINNTQQTVYQEENYKIGGELTYEKKIPLNGRLTLSYRYFRQHQSRTSSDMQLQIINEAVVLTDGKITTLKSPYVDLKSVIVRDITGTIVYQIDLDYFLIQLGNFTEIIRNPSGQILNNSTVFVDYTVTQPGSYTYDMNNNYFSSSIILCKNLIELYFRYNNQDYKNLKQTDFLTLDYINQRIYGTRIDVGFGNAGVEYIDYSSNIVPYKLLRYYILLQGNLAKNIICSLNGNLRNYRMINQEVDQKYADISGMITYMITQQSKINMEVSYRNQRGQEIDLDLITGRTELMTQFHKIYFTIGFEVYNRNYIGEKINYKGVYAQISRKF